MDKSLFRSLQAMGEVTSLALRGEGHMVRRFDEEEKENDDSISSTRRFSLVRIVHIFTKLTMPIGKWN